ncbi:uncharacterized protein LOC141629241 [Silene latifolia]|uniref:uncharacterized protein LOC141629241 n=1 Tax=Silene latifolia TaxID=37657 RepID=UPI003D77508B
MASAYPKYMEDPRVEDTLPVGIEFFRRKLDMDISCGMCGASNQNLEIVEHLFRDCEYTRRIWAGSELGIRVENVGSLSVTDWIIDWIKLLSRKEGGERRVIMFVVVLWGLWNLRNRVKFDALELN